MQPHAQVPYKFPIPPHMTLLRASLAQYGPVRMGYSLTFEAKSDGFGPTDGGLFSPIPAHAILTGLEYLSVQSCRRGVTFVRPITCNSSDNAELLQPPTALPNRAFILQ